MICCSCSVWGWISHNAAVISAVAAVMSAVVAILSLRTNKRIEAAKMRPIITVEIVDIRNVYSLVVKNIGLTEAYDVVIGVSPKIRIMFPPNVNDDIPFLKYPIPNLQPGGDLKCAFVTGYDNLTAISIDKRFSFDLKYKDRHGKEFKEKLKLDLRLITDAAIQVEPGMKEIVDGLAKVEKAIQKIATMKGSGI